MKAIFNYEKELDFLKSLFIKNKNDKKCFHILYGDNFANDSAINPTLHDHNDEKMVKDCIINCCSMMLSKLKWTRDKCINNESKIMDTCDPKFYDGFYEEFPNYHETNKHLNVELGEWDASI